MGCVNTESASVTTISLGSTVASLDAHLDVRATECVDMTAPVTAISGGVGMHVTISPVLATAPASASAGMVHASVPVANRVWTAL